MGDRRYALQPLCDALACSPDALKARLGLDRRQIAAYLERGLSEARADQLAVKAGLPTHLVWPEMIDHEIEDEARECAERSCTVRFVPTRVGHIYCSKVCYRRRWQRERYHADPVFAAMKIASARSYYRENGDYVRARERRRYQARRAA